MCPDHLSIYSVYCCEHCCPAVWPRSHRKRRQNPRLPDSADEMPNADLHPPNARLCVCFSASTAPIYPHFKFGKRVHRFTHTTVNILFECIPADHSCAYVKLPRLVAIVFLCGSSNSLSYNEEPDSAPRNSTKVAYEVLRFVTWHPFRYLMDVARDTKSSVLMRL